MNDIIENEDKLKEECGVYAVFGHDNAAALTALGLHALQHRGQEACGMVTYDGEEFHVKRALGLVGANFGQQSVIDNLPGSMAIGHTRYSTSGTPVLRNVQPLFADLNTGGLALAHNGNLTNAYSLREDLVKDGAIFQSTSDTEVIIHLMARAKGNNIEERYIEAMRHIEGACSMVVMTKNRILGFRDPNGLRPLSLGKLKDSYILASETYAFDIVGAEFIRDIEPGELIKIDDKGVRGQFPYKNRDSRFCIFEYVYFARPDSVVEGRPVYQTRKAMGQELAKEAPVDGGQVVVPVPDGGVAPAMGYAEASGLPYEMGIIRNHYVGRTFIEPTDKIRHLGVKLKHNANRSVVEGKSVILVDDSIVRGTTSTKIVEMIRAAGAREVHMRVTSPPIMHSCFYGIDTPHQKELLGYRYSVEEIAEILGVDSLAYLSLDGLYRAVDSAARDNDAPQFCDACLTGEYPIALIDVEAEHHGKRVSTIKEALK